MRKIHLPGLALRCGFVVSAGIGGSAIHVSYAGHANAIEIPVSSASEITTALQSANPGDVLVMQNGTWTNQVIEFEGHGTATNPITLRAETPGQVVLTGSSRLEISGSHLVADGLHFKDGALSSGHVVQFRGDLGEATHSRLTNSAITNYNPADINTRYFWVSMYGLSLIHISVA